ncbi:MAG: response regulator [Spirochaetia bacterium]|nr:response regulator [Spirochaetia bacterium]
MTESKKSFRLLYVEDDAVLRDILGEEFADHGVEVFKAGGALEALKILKETPIDAVVTDMKMPDIDGVGLKKLADAEVLPAPKVWVALTAYSDRPVADLEAGGFEEVFFKPFNTKMIVHFCRTRLAL